MKKAAERKFKIWIDRCEEIDPNEPDMTYDAESPTRACEMFTDFRGWEESWEGLIVHDVDNDAWWQFKIEQVLQFIGKRAALADFIG